MLASPRTCVKQESSRGSPEVAEWHEARWAVASSTSNGMAINEGHHIHGDRSGRRRGRWLAYLSGAFGLAVSAQLSFLVPLRARELGADVAVIGLIVGAGGFAAALLSVTSGALIDRFGAKRLFVAGTSATALLSAVFISVTDYWWFLLLQPLVGVTNSGGWLASQTYITGLGAAADRPRLTGRFSLFVNAGQMAGPILVGGASQLVGFRFAFVVPVIYSLFFTVVGVALDSQEAERGGSARTPLGAGIRSSAQLVAIRGIQVALLLTFSRLWIARVYGTFLPVFLVDTGFEPGVVGTVMATSGLVAALIAPTTGFWTRFRSPVTVGVVSLGCAATGLLLIPHVAAIPVVYLVPALIGVGMGLSLPLLLSIVSAAAPPDERGVALGLRSMVSQTAVTAAPVAVGPLLSTLGTVLGFTAGGALALAMLLGVRTLHRVDVREQGEA